MHRRPDDHTIPPHNDDVTPSMRASILELAAIIGRDIAQRQVPLNDNHAGPTHLP